MSFKNVTLTIAIAAAVIAAGVPGPAHATETATSAPDATQPGVSTEIHGWRVVINLRPDGCTFVVRTTSPDNKVTVETMDRCGHRRTPSQAAPAPHGDGQ